MAVTQLNYLDFGNLLINELIGDPWLAILIGICIIAVASVKSDLDMKSSFILMIVFSLSVVSFYMNIAILAIGVLLLGLIIYGMVGKVITR